MEDELLTTQDAKLIVGFSDIVGVDIVNCTSWDVLMSIVEKIETRIDNQAYEVDIFGNCIHIANVKDNSYPPHIEIVGRNKKQAVIKGIVKFIQWYKNFNR